MVTTGISRRPPAWIFWASAAPWRPARARTVTIIPRNNFKKTPLHRVDMRFYRGFKLGGRTSIEPTLEVFNLFNRSNFTTYNVIEISPAFGQPTASTLTLAMRRA